MLPVFKIIKPTLIILIIALVGIIGLFGYGFKVANSQGVTFSFAGWVWSDNYGWISLNSDNCLLLTGACIAPDPRVEYSVKIDPNNKITGYAWSENVGWVCFGGDCTNNTAECAGTAPGPTSLDGNSGKITGWAKVCSLGSDGWIKIGRGSFQGASFGEACYDCKPKCTQWTIAMQGDPPAPVPVPPCITYSDTEFDSCNTCFTKTNFDGINIPNPVEESVVGGSGNICTGCNNCHKVNGSVTGTYRIVCNTDNGYIGQCNGCELYGINKNSSDSHLLGWSWGRGTNPVDGDYIGAGWINFNTEFGSSYIVFPWLQTLYGSIYTPKWVRQKAGVEGRNATYCILAQDINVNIKSQNCEDIASGLVQGTDTGFLQQSPGGGIYRNALGKVDITGMTKIVTGTRNKYGQIVKDPAIWSDISGGVLNGQVYHFTSNLQISDNLQFLNGSANVPGNGIIIVDRNLNINRDISYGSGSPMRLNELASVVWIVKGDVIIDPAVTKVVGAFIVLGNGATCQLSGSPDPDYHNYNQNGCGIFFSSSSNKSLTVLGLIIAKAFDFRRTFAEILQGSERIIYDGRLMANPSKALSGFVEGLPVIRDFSY